MQTPKPVNYLTVYKDAYRDDFLASARVGAPFFDRITQAWIITEPDLCRDMLASPSLLPAPVVENYHNMPGELSAQLAEVAYAFDHIPLCLAGDAHASLRRGASEHIASRRDVVARWMDERMPSFVKPFSRAGRFDAASEVIEPMVREMMQTIVGVHLPADLDLDQTSLVFDKSISLSRRTRLADSLAKLRRHIRQAMGPEASEEEVGMRLGLVVIGRDATVGTFAESVVRLLRNAAGLPLNRIAYPKYAPQTGVPFVERIVDTPISAAGINFEPGMRLRIVLQTYSHSPPDTHHRFFGAGAHSCLGRPVSIDLWSSFVRLLAQNSTTVKIVSYELASDNYVFNVPKKFEVEVTA